MRYSAYMYCSEVMVHQLLMVITLSKDFSDLTLFRITPPTAFIRSG